MKTANQNSIELSIEERVLGRTVAVQIPSSDFAVIGGGNGGDTFTGIGGKNNGPPRPDDCATN